MLPKPTPAPQPKKPSPWQCLEAIPGGFAAAAVWRRHLGENFEPFRGAFLQPQAAPALALDDPAEAAPAGSSPAPKDIFFQMNWTRLSNALCEAFDLDRRAIDLPLPDTYQIGSWSIDAVPVILTMPKERQAFRHVICEVGLRLQRPFILLGPTSGHMDVVGHELLAHARAGFFALDSHTVLTEHGSLRLRQAAGELFAQFAPAPRQTVDEDTTRKAFALVKALDQKKLMKRPSPATVFSLYCIDGLSVSDIARKCHCSRGTILNRLAFIRKNLGVDPDHLRQLSASLASHQEQLSDSRARHIHRKNLISDGGEDEEQ